LTSSASKPSTLIGCCRSHAFDDHFHHVALPEPRTKQALPDLLSDIASTPLDYRRPLWQVHVVDCVDGGSAAILRFHHCVGDGTAMMAIAQLLFDKECGAPLDRAPIPLPLPRTGLLDALARPVGRLLEQSAQAVGSGTNLLLHPSQTVKFVQLAAQSAGVAVGTLLKTPDPQSPPKGKLGVPKRMAWSEPIALDAIKAVGKATNAKVNDVLVAATAGALRRYLQARGRAQPGMIIRAIVPVDLRIERLHAIQQAMGAIKRSPEAAVFLAILNIFGRTPRPVEDLAVGIFGSKATLVKTNVAGPRQPLYLAGSRVDRMIFWVPHPGALGMEISILSYDGAVTLGIMSDAGLVPDPEQITAEFNAEFARLHAAAATMAPALCAAPTAVRRPCKNRPLSGSPYCRVHQLHTPRSRLADRSWPAPHTHVEEQPCAADGGARQPSTQKDLGEGQSQRIVGKAGP